MKYLFKNEIIDYDFFDSKKQNTILFLHGWGGNKFSFVSTINLLKNQYNILSISMPTISPTTSIWNMFDFITLVENILSLYGIKNLIIICHSFGFRVAMLLNKKIQIDKIVVTGGAGLNKKLNIIKKIQLNNNKILMRKFNYLYKNIASADYIKLTKTNQETFKNVVNLNLKFASAFDCPMLLFWGTKDKDTKMWILRFLKKHNKTQIITTHSDHFAYLKESSQFNHCVLKFLKNN